MQAQTALLASALLALSASAQTAAEHDRTLRLAHVQSTQQLQEMATVIRSMTDIRQLTTDPDQRLISMRGAADQIALAEWIASKLDLAGTGLPYPAKHEYRMPVAEENLVRVFYFANSAGVQNLQEVATMMRAIVQVRRMFLYPSRSAIAVRGTESQIGTLEWMVGRLDHPAVRQGSKDCRAEGDDVTCLLHLANAGVAPKLQEVATLVRSIAEIRQLFIYNPLQTIAVRGNAAQMAMAEWLVRMLDGNEPKGGPGPHQYRVPGAADDLIRVFYVASAATPQRLNQIAVAARAASGIPRLFTCATLGAISARGSAGQIELARNVIEGR